MAQTPSGLQPGSAPSGGTLTDDLHFVRGVDLPGPVGDPAGVSAALLRAEVPQAQGPLLLTALAHFLLGEESVVLQPLDFRLGVSAGHALEPDGAADGTGDDPPPHLGRMSEARTDCGKTSRRLMFKCWLKSNVSVLSSFEHFGVEPNLDQISNS